MDGNPCGLCAAQREHRLSYFEPWLDAHRHVIQLTSGWTVGPKDGTDDRLGILFEALGSDGARLTAFHQHHGQHRLQAYALPRVIGNRFSSFAFSAC